MLCGLSQSTTNGHKESVNTQNPQRSHHDITNYPNKTHNFVIPKTYSRYGLTCPYTPLTHQRGFCLTRASRSPKNKVFGLTRPYTPLVVACPYTPLHAPYSPEGLQQQTVVGGDFFGNKLTTHTNHKHYVANKKHHRTTKHMIVTIVARLGLM